MNIIQIIRSRRMFKAALKVFLPQIKFKTLTENRNQTILDPDTDISQNQDTSQNNLSLELIRHNPGTVHPESNLRNFQS